MTTNINEYGKNQAFKEIAERINEIDAAFPSANLEYGAKFKQERATLMIALTNCLLIEATYNS